MAKYNTCDNCGANLDPGERCDCASEPELMKPAGYEILTAGKKLIKATTPPIFRGSAKATLHSANF